MVVKATTGAFPNTCILNSFLDMEGKDFLSETANKHMARMANNKRDGIDDDMMGGHMVYMFSFM